GGAVHCWRGRGPCEPALCLGPEQHNCKRPVQDTKLPLDHPYRREGPYAPEARHTTRMGREGGGVPAARDKVRFIVMLSEAKHLLALQIHPQSSPSAPHRPVPCPPAYPALPAK